MGESTKIEPFINTLLVWGKNNFRGFPWRRTHNPYKILIAEVMLQRTKAEQVSTVYKEFVHTFPKPRELAEASLESITESIRSLGLRKRALGLKRLGEQLIYDYDGQVPDNRTDLLKLYGVGNYIANAVLCHAYGVDLPTVDANFARVLSRFFALKYKKPAQKDRKLWSFAETIFASANKRARELNFAIIDLSGLICAPRNPKCSMCPLAQHCAYAAEVTMQHSYRARLRF